MSKVRPHSSCDFEKSLLSASRLKGSIFLPKTATWSLNVQPPSETFIGRLTKNLPKASKAKGTPTQFTILLWAKRMDPKVKNTLLKNFQKKSHIFFSSALDSPHGLASGWNSGPRCTQQPNFYLLVAFLSVVLSAKNWQNQQNWNLPLGFRLLTKQSKTIPYPQYDHQSLQLRPFQTV